MMMEESSSLCQSRLSSVRQCTARMEWRVCGRVRGDTSVRIWVAERVSVRDTDDQKVEGGEMRSERERERERETRPFIQRA